MASENVIDQRGGVTVVVGDLAIDLVERIVVRVERVGLGIAGLAIKRPISVVVQSPAGTFRFDLEETEVTDDGGTGWS